MPLDAPLPLFEPLVPYPLTPAEREANNLNTGTDYSPGCEHPLPPSLPLPPTLPPSSSLSTTLQSNGDRKRNSKALTPMQDRLPAKRTKSNPQRDHQGATVAPQIKRKRGKHSAAQRMVFSLLDLADPTGTERTQRKEAPRKVAPRKVAPRKVMKSASLAC